MAPPVSSHDSPDSRITGHGSRLHAGDVPGGGGGGSVADPGVGATARGSSNNNKPPVSRLNTSIHLISVCRCNASAPVNDSGSM